MVVWSPLQPWKHSLIDRTLQVVQSLLPLGVHTPNSCGKGKAVKNGDAREPTQLLQRYSTFPVEDDSGAAASQRLVRRRGNNVTVVKGRGHDPGGHQAADVSHVPHQIRAVLRGDLLQAGVVQVAGVAAGSWVLKQSGTRRAS